MTEPRAGKRNRSKYKGAKLRAFRQPKRGSGCPQSTRREAGRERCMPPAAPHDSKRGSDLEENGGGGDRKRAYERHFWPCVQWGRKEGGSGGRCTFPTAFFLPQPEGRRGRCTIERLLGWETTDVRATAAEKRTHWHPARPASALIRSGGRGVRTRRQYLWRNIHSMGTGREGGGERRGTRSTLANARCERRWCRGKGAMLRSVLQRCVAFGQINGSMRAPCAACQERIALAAGNSQRQQPPQKRRRSGGSAARQ